MDPDHGKDCGESKNKNNKRRNLYSHIFKNVQKSVTDRELRMSHRNLVFFV